MQLFTRILILLALSAALLACQPGEPQQQNNEVPMQTIDQAIDDGQFQQAEALIANAMADSARLSTQQWMDLYFRQALIKRIRLDFSKTEPEVTEFLTRYYPELDTTQLRQWEASGALEMRKIDGQRRYFKYAVYNLFRLDSAAKVRKREIDGHKADPLKAICLENTRDIIQEVKNTGNTLAQPKKIRYRYTLTVNADAVPAGETVRCWLPFPKSGHARQQAVELLDVSQNDYQLAPDSVPHRTLYMEKVARAGEPTTFAYEVRYTSRGQWFPPNELPQTGYNKESAIYKQYTAEKPPHVVFSDDIQTLAKQIVGDAQSPYEKVTRIYEWIDREIPWASALEYSTFRNIPQYVLDNRHGDCGMQTLLFIALARYSGVPAKWQSGWMMHPGEVNLHDWAEVYYPGIGWVPVDQSFELQATDDPALRYFYTSGIDSYRLIVNDSWSEAFYPAKQYPRSETVDFQRGEVEWAGGNLYFNQWSYNMQVDYE